MNTIEINEVNKCESCDNYAKIVEVEVVDTKVIYAKYTCECKNEFKGIVGWIDIITQKELQRKSVGQILSILKNNSFPNKSIKTNIPGSEFIKNEYGSDRGDYSSLYIEVCDDNRYGMDLNAFIDLLSNALDDGCMYGYKGGEYDINEETLITLGNYGCCGKYIINAIEEDDCIRIIVEMN